MNDDMSDPEGQEKIDYSVESERKQEEHNEKLAKRFVRQDIDLGGIDFSNYEDQKAEIRRINAEITKRVQEEVQASRKAPVDRLASHKILVPGHEVTPREVLTFTKTGRINTQSTLGKISAAINDAGFEIKFGHSRYQVGDKEPVDHYWMDAAVRGKRLTVDPEGVWLSGQRVTKEQALAWIKEEE